MPDKNKDPKDIDKGKMGQGAGQDRPDMGKKNVQHDVEQPKPKQGGMEEELPGSVKKDIE